MAVVVVGPKYAYRQARLERMNNTREQIASGAVGEAVETSDPDLLITELPRDASRRFTLGPLAAVLAILLALAAVARGRAQLFEKRRPTRGEHPSEASRMSWLVEDPTPTLVALVLCEAILVLALVKTGRGALLGVIAGVALLGVGLLALEWFVVTEKETVEDTLSGAARALESNDPQAVISFIDPATPMRREVAGEMVA